MIHRTYADLARHYGAVVLPARAAHPKDKPKVEVSVQIAQRWILAVLRHQTFFTLADLNTSIRTCLEAVNARPMQVVGVSRRVLFEQLDRPALRALPTTRYELATWKPCRVNIDYHVEIDHNWYSVPYQLVHVRVEARVTATTIEVFLRGQRVASHARLTGRGRYSTDVAHMPRSHRAHAEGTPSRLIAWADQTGPATGRFVAGILERRPHPEQGYRACLGLMRLGRHHGLHRLDAACARAERLRSYSYRTVEHILKNQQERLPLDEPAPARPALPHENLRGATYYEEIYADAPDDRDHHLLITGPTGIGKSWLASAFVQSACRHGFSATYVRAPRLLHDLAVSRGDGSYGRLLAKLAKLDLLAIDDWLLAPLTDSERRDLLEVLEDRSERTSTLIASQLPPTAWHAAIGEPSVADAICDRLIHHAHRLTLKRPTMRDPGTPARAQGEGMRATRETGLWIVPDPWKTRRRVSHRSLDGAQTAPPTTLHRPFFLGVRRRSSTSKMTFENEVSR